MRVVGIRELKNRLSEYIRHVNAGEEILVTDRGKVVAEIRSPGNRSRPKVAGFTRLAREGLLTFGTRNKARAYPRQPRLRLSTTVKQILDAERGPY